MRNVGKICVGTAVLVGVVGMAAKFTEHCRKTWFARGFEAGHLVDYTDGASEMAKMSHEVAETAEQIAKHNTEIVCKYDALCSDYE